VSVRSESKSLSLLLLSIEDSLLLLSTANVNFQRLYVFAMNDKVSPPCININTSSKCSYLFPYFLSLESRLASEQTLHITLRSHNMFFLPSDVYCSFSPSLRSVQTLKLPLPDLIFSRFMTIFVPRCCERRTSCLYGIATTKVAW
jgi:hypothetical protein